MGLFSKLFGGEPPEKAAGAAFLAENAGNPGIVVCDSGLQYKVIKEGGADHPGPTESVTVHYEGKLLDGTVFDSSYSRNEPATFPLDAVIKGWTEGVQLMVVGEKRRFWIPASIGYGDRGGGGGLIPGGAMLVFDIELLGIQ